MNHGYHVIKPYQSESTEPLMVSAGDRLRFERRKTNWGGWLWCTDETGKTGWVPETWVKIDGKVCVMKRDYNAVELTVSEGDVLKSVLVESGWLLAIAPEGRRGWVPLECVEPM